MHPARIKTFREIQLKKDFLPDVGQKMKMGTDHSNVHAHVELNTAYHHTHLAYFKRSPKKRQHGSFA